MKRKGAGSKDVAKEAGVSQATVSYVLNNTPNVKIKPETRQLVLDAAKRLNYHTNIMARNMRMKKTECIGVVTGRSMSNAVFMTVLDGIRASLIEQNYSITLCLPPSESGSRIAECIKYFNSRVIDGVIFVLTGLTDEEKQTLNENDVPYVMINALAEDDARFQVKTGIGNAMSEAVEYLANSGISEIGYLGRMTGNLGARRYASFTKALGKHGIDVNEDIIQKISRNEEQEKIDVEYFFETRKKLPRALFCEGVNAALHTLRYAYKKNIRVPEEMAVIAIGTSQYSGKFCPALSAIEAPLFEMGQTGVKMLFEQLDGVEEPTEGNLQEDSMNHDIVTLEWSFAKRESC